MADHIEPPRSSTPLSLGTAVPLECNGRVGLASVWTALVSGQAIITDEGYTETACYLALANAQAGPLERRVGARGIAVLERILLGESQKAIAVDLLLSPASIATIAARVLRALGLECMACRVPMLLIMALHAHRGTLDSRDEVPWGWEFLGCNYRVIGAPRPDTHLDTLLTMGECAVARMLVEGQSHAAIARSRKTSTRTIANQLNRTYFKLGVSGRVDLLRQLLTKAPSMAKARLAAQGRETTSKVA